MRSRLLRLRLSPAMIVALLALFVALGGTAIAAFVVSSNSQIGPNTIYGANAPTGANKNVNANSLTGVDILESSLARVPSAGSALNGARRIQWDPTGASGGFQRIFALDEMTINAQCSVAQSTGNLQVRVDSSVAGDINWALFELTHFGDFAPDLDGRGSPGAAQWNLVFLGVSGSGQSERVEGQFIYRNANRIITVALHAFLASPTGGSPYCQIRGTAIPAPS